MPKSPNTAPQPEHAEQAILRDIPWDRRLKALGWSVSSIADQQAPLSADMRLLGSFEPNETYWAAAEGNYRLLHTFGGSKSHVEIDYYPASPDPDRLDQDPHQDEPIVRFTATIPNEHAESSQEQYEYNLQYEHGSSAGRQDVRLDETQQDADGLRQINRFLSQVSKELPERPDATVPSTQNTRELISDEHRLEAADRFLFVDDPKVVDDDDQKTVVRERLAAATAMEEQEIARAAAAELLKHGVQLGTDPTKQEQPGIEAQYRRMQTELAAMYERNAQNKGKRGDPVGGAGRNLTHEPSTAEALAQRRLRAAPATLKFPEAKIPSDGLTKIPKDHFMVFIARSPLTNLGRERYVDRNTIVAMAGPGTEFSTPFFGWRNSQYRIDPADRDVTFEQPSHESSAADTGAIIRTGLREQQGKGHIERVLLVGPGDNVVMTRHDRTQAVEHLVSNIGGLIYIDGKPVSRRQAAKLQKRLTRLVGRKAGENLVKSS